MIQSPSPLQKKPLPLFLDARLQRNRSETPHQHSLPPPDDDFCGSESQSEGLVEWSNRNGTPSQSVAPRGRNELVIIVPKILDSTGEMCRSPDSNVRMP